MARVFIPPPLRRFTRDQEIITVAGRNVREVIANLDAQFPGIQDELIDNDELRSGIAVAVGTAVSSLGLLERVEEDTEVHFLPAISGG